MATGARSRCAAQCANCGRVLAARFSADEIRPIGSVNGCPCGSTSFRPLAAPIEFDG